MTVATASDASSAPGAPAAFEVVLPEGLSLPALEDLGTPAAPPTTDSESGPPSAPSPQAVSPPRPGQPSQREREAIAARDEERRKRKTLAGQYRDLQSQYADLANRSTTIQPTRESPEQRKARLAKLRGRVVERLPAIRKKAEDANSVGEVAELVVTTVLDAIDDRHTDLLQELDAREQSFVHSINTTRSEIDEKLFRRDHPDYDEVLRKAGIFDAIQVANGQFRDPVIARQIYTKGNHAQAAYELAQSKLAFEADQRGEEPAAGAPPAAPGAPASPQAITEAERRGRQHAFDALADTTNHAQGVRHLPPAGGPRRATITKEYLDELADQRPTEYLRLMDANPELERWHLS